MHVVNTGFLEKLLNKPSYGLIVREPWPTSQIHVFLTRNLPCKFTPPRFCSGLCGVAPLGPPEGNHAALGPGTGLCHSAFVLKVHPCVGVWSPLLSRLNRMPLGGRTPFCVSFLCGGRGGPQPLGRGPDPGRTAGGAWRVSKRGVVRVCSRCPAPASPPQLRLGPSGLAGAPGPGAADAGAGGCGAFGTCGRRERRCGGHGVQAPAAASARSSAADEPCAGPVVTR